MSSESCETSMAIPVTKSTSLDSLPLELLPIIGHHLPVPALAALARTSRKFRAQYGSRTRETTHLLIPPHYGEAPYTLPGDLRRVEIRMMEDDEAEAALERRAAAFDAGIREGIEHLEEEAQRQKNQEQLEEGEQAEVEEEDRREVKELKLCALPSSRSSILTLVRVLAPHLTRMQVTMGGIIEKMDEGKAFGLMLECVSSLPNLRQLALTSSEFPKNTLGLARAIRKNRSIEDLCWNIAADRFWSFFGSEECKHIKRLMFMGESEIDTVSFRCLPLMPHLEEVCFAQSPDLPIPPTGLLPTPHPPEAFPMVTHFAYNLHRCPTLRTIRYLDLALCQNGLDLLHQLDSGNAPLLVAGRIAFMTHAGQEVLHAQFRQNFIEKLDCKWGRSGASKLGSHVKGDVLGVQYTCLQGTSLQTARVKSFQLHSNSGHVHHTSYREFGVPLEIIRRMQEVEGGDKDWDQRGVEVGKAAWDVLKEWHATL